MSRVPNHVHSDPASRPAVGERTGRLADAVLTLVDDAIYGSYGVRLAVVSLVAVSGVAVWVIHGVGIIWTLVLLAIGIAVVSVLVFSILLWIDRVLERQWRERP